MVSKHQPTFKLTLCYGTLSIAPCIAPQGDPNGVNHISMYLGYHNIEIKTRDFSKLNFGIWNIVRFLAGFCVKPYLLATALFFAKRQIYIFNKYYLRNAHLLDSNIMLLFTKRKLLHLNMNDEAKKKILYNTFLPVKCHFYYF